ncbi:hypothetical protein VTK73DRAFT_1118 [Phialemonium thermophilum]|uniref:C6 transcription factor n=1 Tax=Phialemonium thermophilum TaxID=223376 RepID=A0ABR3VTV0_9PEZI
MALLASWRGDLAAYQSFNIPSVADPDDSFREENGWSTTTTTTLSYDHLRSLLAWQDRTQLRAALVLHMQYRHIAIMVTRPFLLRDTAMARAAARDARHQTAGGDVVSESCAQLAELCVQNACQLAKMFLLLDEFGLADGVCGMDVFYAYSASMVLILRSVREGIREPGAPETKVQGDLRRLISALRRVVFKVAKSGTMKRFARVMAMFEDSVFHHSAAVVPRAEQIRRDTVAAPRDESGVPFGPTGIEGPQLAGRFAPVDLSTLPHVPSMTSLLDTTFPGAETWPQGDWGTFDESRELSGWIASLLQPLDTTTTAADYEDVDWVLRNAPM